MKRVGIFSLSLLGLAVSASVAAETPAATQGFENAAQLQTLLQGMCRTHPGVQIQQLEVQSLRAQRDATASKDWMPEMTLSAGPQYADGEPVGFFAIDGAGEDTFTPVGPNGETISAKAGSGFYGEARADLKMPLYKDSQWIGQDSPDERVANGKISYEETKVQKVYQENVLELIDALISANEIAEKEKLLQKLNDDALEQLEIAQNAAKAKVIDRSDLLMVEENVLTVKGELKKVAKTRQFIAQKLAFYTGTQTSPEVLRISLQTLPSIASLEEVVAASQQQNTELALQEKQVVVAEQNLAKARDQNGIQFGLKSSYQSVGDKDLSNEKNFITTGLNLEVPIDDLLSSRKESKYWVLQVQKEKQKLAYLRENLRLTTAENYDSYQQEMVTLESAHASLNRARQDFIIDEELFRKGRISSKELIDSRSHIYEIELSKLQAYAKLWALHYKLQPAAQWSCDVNTGS